MSEQILLDSYPLGWCPSYNQQNDFGQPSRCLLRMDNLTQDLKGSVRLANRNTSSGSVGAAVNSIFGAFMAAMKYRYVYTAAGNMYRNYGGAASLTTFDKAIGTGAAVNKAAWLIALGHTLCLAGSIQVKDRGDIQWPITIPQPAAPVVTNQAANQVFLANLDGSNNYTNWTSTAGTSFVNTGADITITANTYGLASIQTTFATDVDTTNFGVTGEDTPNDLFVFNVEVSDATQLIEIWVELTCQDPAGTVTDEYAVMVSPNGNQPNTVAITNLVSGSLTPVYILRSDFTRYGNTAGLTMANIKGVRITFYCLSAVSLTYSGIFAFTGVVGIGQTYVAVEYNDTGQFVEYSIASAEVTVTGGSGQFIKVDRSGTACNSQCNGIMFFRNNTTLGQFLLVDTQTGAYGFTPASFVDSMSDQTALEDAAVSVVPNVLQYYRTQLPTNLIGGIYFASRVIYLTPTSFLPSFQLDLGSYDSRFEYQLNSTNSEQCLFICALSIGTFIVATTVDFYQVTGSFNLVSTTNADGTVTTTQDVTIQKLGISDPAISSQFAEVEGNIIYMSSKGLRSMSNGTSVLLNTTTDLLFRGEARWGIPSIALLPNDQSLMGIVVSGYRTYLALPFSDAAQRIMVATFNIPLPTELRGENYWRLLTAAANCLNKEQDGTVIFGDSSGGIWELEDSFTGSLSIDLLTQYNYGQKPSQTKSLGSLLLYVNTGGASLTLAVNGLLEDGVTVLTYTTQINSNGLGVVAVDPHGVLVDCIAYQMQISGEVAVFELAYAIFITVQEYPPITFYELVPFTNFGKDTLKKLSKWGFVVDTLGGSVEALVTADNQQISSIIDHSAEPQGICTEFWFNEKDIAALDWQLELIAATGMHFYKFMPPDILQVFPPGRMLDQVGPLDLDMEGIVYGFRLRVYNTGTTLNYEVYDNDISTWSNGLSTPINQDYTLIEKFPKGINTSVCRILITSPTQFYRFSLEVEIRTTGKETEQKWVKIGLK